MSGDYHARANRIVDRVLPALPVAHGFYDPQGFAEAARRQGERKRLYWRTFARLRAKVEGGPPRIDMPKGSDRVLSGGIMWQVARELEAAAHG